MRERSARPIAGRAPTAPLRVGIALAIGSRPFAVRDDVGMSEWGYTIYATKKLLERTKAPLGDPVEGSSSLGNWYATVWFWKPQVALFVNERTLLPVLMPLAPASTLASRFPAALRQVLDSHGVDPRFVDAEMEAMGGATYAKTASRSMLGVMNEFGYLGEAYRDSGRIDDDLITLALELANTPMGPLHKRHGFPDLELKALVADVVGGG
jgi:hypothetical protein